MTFWLTFAMFWFQQAAPRPANISALTDKASVPGPSIAVIRNGKIASTDAFGVRSLQSKTSVNKRHRFNVGSLSKPVFAYGVLRLVDAGKLKLDEPLVPYLPKEFVAGDPRFNQVTACMVLSHRTGFPNWPEDGKPLTIHFTPRDKGSVTRALGWYFCNSQSRRLPARNSTITCKRLCSTPWG
jgi:CubicO group peptidase (beta-lactamase class C family)